MAPPLGLGPSSNAVRSCSSTWLCTNCMSPGSSAIVKCSAGSLVNASSRSSASRLSCTQPRRVVETLRRVDVLSLVDRRQAPGEPVEHRDLEVRFCARRHLAAAVGGQRLEQTRRQLGPARAQSRCTAWSTTPAPTGRRAARSAGTTGRRCRPNRCGRSAVRASGRCARWGRAMSGPRRARGRARGPARSATARGRGVRPARRTPPRNACRPHCATGTPRSNTKPRPSSSSWRMRAMRSDNVGSTNCSRVNAVRSAPSPTHGSQARASSSSSGGLNGSTQSERAAIEGPTPSGRIVNALGQSRRERGNGC